MSELDLLAIACIEKPNDYAAWASLCDYCADRGLQCHPWAMVWALSPLMNNARSVKVLAKSMAYSSESKTEDNEKTMQAFESWALPLLKTRRDWPLEYPE